MGEDTDTGNVGRLYRVRVGIVAFQHGTDEIMHQMRVRATMTTALGKAQVLIFLIIHAAPGEGANFFRQQMSVVRHFYSLGNFRLRLATGDRKSTRLNSSHV